MEIKKEPEENIQIIFSEDCNLTSSRTLRTKIHRSNKRRNEITDHPHESPKAKRIKFEEICDEVKKEPDVNFFNLSQKAPKMPKALKVKREVTQKKIKASGGKTRTTFSEFQCEICEIYLGSERSLKAHTERHFQSLYKCSKCEKAFKLKTQLEAHQCDEQSCQFCDKILSSTFHLSAHIEREHAEIDWTCDFCDKKFWSRNFLLNHLKKCRHVAQGAFECDCCGKKFNKKDLISQHMKAHAALAECKVCHVKLKSQSLRNHMKLIHTGNESECKVCHKVFKSVRNLRAHQKIHESKRFACVSCDLKFLTQGKLNCHRILHDNPEQLKCKICGHQATQKGHLRIHLKKMHQ